MSNEIRAQTGTGKTLYAVAVDATGRYGVVSGATVESFTIAHWSTYAIALTEANAPSQQYFATMPLFAAGIYEVDLYLQSGGSPSITADRKIGSGFMDWSGTAEIAGGGGSIGSTAPAGWINTAAFASGATLPRVTLADTVTTYTGNTPQTGDAFARLGAPSGASISADVQTRAASTQIPTHFTAGTFQADGVFSTGALANAPSGGGGGTNLSITGTVSAVTNGGSFAVVFDSPGYDGNAAALTGGTLRLSFTSGLNHLQSSLITGGTLTDTTHASLTFTSAFSQAVQVGDTVTILTN